MADGDIKLGIRVDTSQLNGGLAQAQAAVQAAMRNMADAQANFGKAAESGNVQAAEALKLYQTELNSAQDALVAFSQTEEAETQVLRSNISARMAASAELRVLSGNLQGSTRAAGAFLATLPGIGVAMQAAFPIFGVVALIGVLGQAVGAVHGLIQAFKDLDGAAEKAQVDAILAGNKIVSVKSDKFTKDSFARLYENAPANPDNISIQNASVKLKEIQQARELADAQAAVNEQGKTGVALQKQKVEDAQKEVEYAREAKAQADQLVTAYTKLATEKVTVTTPVIGGEGLTVQQQVAKISDPKQLAEINKQLQTAKTASEDFGHEMDILKVKLQGTELKLPEVEDKEAAAAKRKADAEARKLLAAQRAEQNEEIQADNEYLEKLKSTHTLTSLEESNYWIGRAAIAQAGGKEYQHAIDESNRALGRAQKETQTLSSQVGEELTESWLKAETVTKEVAKQQSELANNVAQDAEKMQAAQEGAAEAIAQANLKAGEASGNISKLAAAHQEAAIHAKAYADELARLDAALTRVSQDAALNPEQRAAQVGQLQAQKVQVQGQAQASGIADQSAINQQIAQPWLSAFNQINQGWLQVQDRMLFSTRHIGLEFAKMGQQLVISGINSAESWALKWAEKELLSLVIHQSTNAAKTTSDAAANATAAATTAAANVAMAESYAAVAAVAAMASAAAIPVVGWTIAPGAGAAVYGEAQGFAALASFDVGTGYVPRDGVAMLHQGEAVIPAPTMNDLRQSSTTNGGDININQNVVMHGSDDTNFRKMLDKHASFVASAVRKHMRQAGH
jgi:hypothetical protein